MIDKTNQPVEDEELDSILDKVNKFKKDQMEILWEDIKKAQKEFTDRFADITGIDPDDISAELVFTLAIGIERGKNSGKTVDSQVIAMSSFDQFMQALKAGDLSREQLDALWTDVSGLDAPKEPGNLDL